MKSKMELTKEQTNKKRNQNLTKYYFNCFILIILNEEIISRIIRNIYLNVKWKKSVSRSKKNRPKEFLGVSNCEIRKNSFFVW